MAAHPIVHIELSAQDPVTAGRFYNELFGWKIEPMPEFNYATFEAEGGPGGGFVKIDDSYPAGMVLVYVHTDDIPASLEKAVSLGAKQIMPETEIQGIGRFAIFEDPSGNRLALFREIMEP